AEVLVVIVQVSVCGRGKGRGYAGEVRRQLEHAFAPVLLAWGEIAVPGDDKDVAIRIDCRGEAGHPDARQFGAALRLDGMERAFQLQIRVIAKQPAGYRTGIMITMRTNG